MEKAPPPSVLQSFLDWVDVHVWSLNAQIALGIMAACFVVSALIARILHERATKALETPRLPSRTKRMARRARRAILPAVNLGVLFIVTKATLSVWADLDVSLVTPVMKVLLAWIVIRLSLLFIDNSLVRNIFTWFIWVVAALSIFGILDETLTTLDSLAIDIGAFRLSALKIVNSVIMVFVLLYGAIFVSAFFERRVLKSKSLTRSSQVLVAKIIRILLIMVAFIIGVTSAGIDLSVFAVFGGAIGLGIGFGLQKAVSNLFSGMLLLMDQSIKPGDVIELEAGTFGFVNEMAARYTEIVTRDGKSYLIPNEEFITQRVINWSHGSQLIRLQVEFGVDYKANPHEVIAIALEAVSKLPRVVKEPAPQCFLKEFGESSINFLVQFWITDVDQGTSNIKSALLLALWDAFKAKGISIPYPHREIYMHSVD